MDSRISLQLRHYLILASIVAVGSLLRFVNLNAVSLRGDEAFTVIHWMREPFLQTVSAIATIDPQPPLAYLLYRLYSLVVGSQEPVVRFLPAILSLLVVPALYGIGHRVGGRLLGYVCALVIACAPYAIWHAQDARNYAIWLSVSAVALWLALCALDRGLRWDWILYVVMACFACYLYYLELFVLLCLNMYVFAFYWRVRAVFVKWIVAQAVLFLLLLPWFANPELLSGGGYGGTAGGFQPALWLTWFLPVLFYGVGLPSDFVGLWVVLLIVVLGGGVVALYRLFSRRFLFLFLLLGVLPLLLLGLVSLRLNVFVPRYVLVSSLAYVVLFSAFVVGIYWTRLFWLKLVGSLLVCGVVLGLLVSLWNYFFVYDYAKSHPWRELAAYLDSRVLSGDSIINTAADPALTFYLGERQVPVQEFYLPANPRQSAQEITGILQERLGLGSVWVVAEPAFNWENRDVVDSYLESEAQLVRSLEVNGLRVDEYAPYESEFDNRPALATFADIVSLVGADTWQEPNNTISVWLYWNPLSQADTPLKVFVHLMGDINPQTGTPLWTQDDQFPQDSRISTTNWEIGATFRDVYTLSLDNVPQGSYRLVVGWYDPVTGERIYTGEADHFTIADIVVE